MARMAPTTIAVSSLVCAAIYLWWLNRGIKAFPAKLKGVVRKPWTKEQLRAMYQKVQESPTDIRPFLPAKKNRRYIVTGGSGQMGGWMVQHLLLRGEDPAAIRILDLNQSTRPEVAENNIAFFATDVGDEAAVSKAFNAKWPAKISKLPLTVLHTVAYIKPDERKADFMYMYDRVNINGTRHVLNAAKAAGASCFVATSSGGVGIAKINFFFPPWRTAPANQVQSLATAKIHDPPGSLSDYGSCYTYSKIVAENLVRNADDKAAGFRTGILRPGHVLYGHGVNTPSSAVYHYLETGGAPSWLHNLAINFGNGQNISIAHLAFEHTLLSDPSSKAGGQVYFCSDPDPPITFGELYKLLGTLVHPMKPCNFPPVPIAPMLILAYVFEGYNLLRARYLGFLPRIAGDIGLMQPAIFQMSTIHTIYDNGAAERAIGYKPPITTLEGLCHQVFFFNQHIDAQVGKVVAEGKRGAIEPNAPSSIVSAPVVT